MNILLQQFGSFYHFSISTRPPFMAHVICPLWGKMIKDRTYVVVAYEPAL